MDKLLVAYAPEAACHVEAMGDMVRVIATAEVMV